MPPQTLAAVAAIVSFAVHGNRIEFRMDHGSAELTWVSPDSFRFRRSLEGPLPAAARADKEPVEIKAEDAPGAVRMRSKNLEVTVQKRGVLVSVRRFDGEPLMRDLSEPRTAGKGVAWDRAMPPGSRFYGLGRGDDPTYDWRGKAGETEVPFLLSSTGYGEYHPGGGPFRFDFTAADRYRVQAPGVDYYFLYGLRPKAVFEALHDAAGRDLGVPAASGGPPPSWASLREELLRLTHGFLSAMLHQGFDLARYAGAPPDLLARAKQVGSLVPDVQAGSLELSGFRRQLKTFFAAYEPETREKGYPLWHPLPFQFPDDPECARHADEFMLGDEMLIAPICDASGQRSFYLPPGVWTNLETNEVAQGRRTITIKTESLPVFARNGTIIPLDSPGGMGLHYFPQLAAEFFVLETEVNDWTQIHASPAAEIYRLQIDSKVARDYQWVIHHVERPSTVGYQEIRYGEAGTQKELSDRTWFYETAKKNLHVRVRVNAGESSVIHIGW
ncbi:MAG: hypothetical protein LAQ30_24205 [Acidobacteriia bacterium]|nr:hypothetical protein [Terriglobia bacterium]